MLLHEPPAQVTPNDTHKKTGLGRFFYARTGHLQAGFPIELIQLRQQHQ